MDARQAACTLEVIRTLMERTCQYQLLTARASLVAGSLAGLGALSFFFLNPANPVHFGLVWGVVFLGALLAISIGTVIRSREIGEQIWSRQARTVLKALAPSFVAACVLTGFFFLRGDHLTLPGVWMLCYGQGALATAAYAPWPIRYLGIGFLLLGALTLGLGASWAAPLMGMTFGVGHLALGATLFLVERRAAVLKIHRSVA